MITGHIESLWMTESLKFDFGGTGHIQEKLLRMSHACAPITIFISVYRVIGQTQKRKCMLPCVNNIVGHEEEEISYIEKVSQMQVYIEVMRGIRKKNFVYALDMSVLATRYVEF